MTTKLVFLDADDTFLTPPYDAIKKVSGLLGKPNFPAEHVFTERSHIDFHVAFPEIFGSKNKMWLMALASLPFGFFKSYKLHPELDPNQLASLLQDVRVIVLSKNPPSFAPARRRRIMELTGVDLDERYIACGPIFQKSTPKIEIIRAVARDLKVDLSHCLLVDDSFDNTQEAALSGVPSLLVDAPWNGTAPLEDFPLITRVKRENFMTTTADLLNANTQDMSPTQTVRIFPRDSISGSQDQKDGMTLVLERKTFAHIFRKGPHNEVIEAFAELIARDDFVNYHVVLVDGKGTEWPISNLERFRAPQPELNIASAIRFRAFCRSEFEKLGFRFELPALFNFYYRPRASIVKEILSDEIVKEAVIEHIKKESITLTEANGILRRHVSSIIHQRTFRGCFFNFHLVNTLFSRIFRSINVTIPDSIRNSEEEYFTIFAPIHRSYLDSGVLFAELGKVRQHFPYIVAADKMLHNWLGRLGTVTGAFFIARKHMDVMYSAVITAHLKQIHRDGASLEVFIEGSRSRSGLTLPPKRGIISSVDSNRRYFPNRKVAIIPVAFAYNKLPESEMLLAEVYEERRKEGKASLREQADFYIERRTKKTFWDKVMGARRQLVAKSISDCYITMGEPVFLGEKQSLLNLKSKGASPSVQDSLNEVMFRINRMTPILPSSVVCLALLSSKDHHTTSDNVRRFLELTHRFVALYNIDEGALFKATQIDQYIDEALSLPFINRKFKDAGIDERWILSLTEMDSTRVAHYKNNVLHYFVLPATLANILTYSTKPVKREELHRYLDHLFNDLSIKYFLPISSDSNGLINEILMIFANLGYISRHGDSYLFSGETDDNAPFMMLSNLAEDFAKSDLLYAFSRFRRTFQRVEMEISATLRQGENEFPIQIRNLSVGGALITCEAILEKDQEVKVSIPFDNKRFVFKGRVMRSEEFGSGIQFLDVEDYNSNILLMIISYYSTSNTPSDNVITLKSS